MCRVCVCVCVCGVCVCACVGQLYHQYSPVAVSVDAPELDVGLGLDRGGSRGAVDQSQLSEAAASPDAGGPLTVHAQPARKHTGV